MDHSEAIRLKATEQYLLGELPVSLRDEFEDHFMTCGECAQDVRTGAALLGNIRGALEYETTPEPGLNRPGHQESWIAALFRPAIAIPAFAILLCVIAYQGFVTIPRLQTGLSRVGAPTAVASFSLLAGSSRGEASVPVAVKRDQGFILYVDIPPQPAFPLYTLDVESAAGAFEFSVPISAEQARNSVEVFVPAAKLDPGDYVMIIRGAHSQTEAPGTEVARMRFSLKYKG